MSRDILIDRHGGFGTLRSAGDFKSNMRIRKEREL